jgi:hypothetical protein
MSTEARLGEMMLAQARREGHRALLPKTDTQAAWQSEQANERRQMLEDAIFEVLRKADRPLVLREIVQAVDPSKPDAIGNALRRFKASGVARTVYMPDRMGKTNIGWRVA